jgi:hypothetical protein
MDQNQYDPITGKPVDKSYLEMNLPGYLQKDLDSYKAGNQEDSLEMEPLWYDLYATINEALNEEDISDEMAKYLRNKYLFKKRGEIL